MSCSNLPKQELADIKRVADAMGMTLETAEETLNVLKRAKLDEIPVDDDIGIWERHGNCLREAGKRVVVCHCANCKGK